MWWFNKWKKKRVNSKESAPQLTTFQRQNLQTPGLPPGGLPYAVYRAMEMDPMIQTALTIKKQAVMAVAWRIVPKDSSSRAREAALFVEDNLHQMHGSASTVLTQAMDAFSMGWSIQEMVFRPVNDQIWLQAIRPKDPSLFGLQMDAFGNIEQLRLQLPGETPLDLPRDRFVIFVNRQTYGKPKGQSDLDAVHPHWVAKQALSKAWKLHLERFASPTILGKYQRGLPSEEQTSVLRALQGLQDTLAIVYPSEIEIQTLGGDKASSSAFQDAIEFHNREIGRAILGQTLTTDEGRRVGSLALGKVHLQVLLLQLSALRKLLADQVMTEQVIRPLVEMNFGADVVPRFEFEEQPLEAFVTGKIA